MLSKKHSPSFLRSMRENSGYTRSELAAEIGVGRSYLWRLETGGPAKLTPERAEKIASALAVDQTILFGGTFRVGGGR